MANDRQINEVLTAINRFSRKCERHFEFIDERFTVVEDKIDSGLNVLRADLTSHLRKADGKMNGLLDLLRRRNVISERDRSKLLAMGPYPQR